MAELDLAPPSVSTLVSPLDGILVCPSCRKLLPSEAQWRPDAIPCACGHVIPRVRQIPRFVEDDQYVGSFSHQWQAHAQTQLDNEESDESERSFRQKTGLTPEDVRGKRVLDVGCGMGRFSDVVSRWGAELVGIDLSLAVESAQKNIGARPNVRFLQADVFQLPFAPASFDIIFSLGVLHHTPDCRRAFQSLIPLVKPGGIISIWVYARMGAYQNFTDRYRVLTTRLPTGVLHQLCKLAVPLYYVYQVPVLGEMLSTLLPVSNHPRASWRVLDTFDWYSPRYQSKHTYPEVFAWFKEAGLVDLDLLEFPVSIRGRKRA